MPRETVSQTQLEVNLSLTAVRSFELDLDRLNRDLLKIDESIQNPDPLYAPTTQALLRLHLSEGLTDLNRVIMRNRGLLEQLRGGDHIGISRNIITSIGSREGQSEYLLRMKEAHYTSPSEVEVLRVIGEDVVLPLSTVELEHLLGAFFPHDVTYSGDPHIRENSSTYDKTISALNSMQSVVLHSPYPKPKAKGKPQMHVKR